MRLEPEMELEGSKCGLARLYYKRIAQEATLVAAEAFCVKSIDIMGRRNKASVVFARQIAMYLAHVVGQMSMGQVAVEFGRERSTVGYSCSAIEDKRDSPIFNKQVEFLEQQLQERLTILLTQELQAEVRLEQKHHKMRLAAG